MTMWNNVILCLGSNTDCEANLKSAVSLLRAYFGSIRFSEASKQKGKIPIDIDLLLWNGTILKPADWEKEYVQLLFRSVAD